MKTFKEAESERAEGTLKSRAQRLADSRDKLALIETLAIPLFKPDDERDRSDYEAARRHTREMIRSDDSCGSWAGVACDHCAVEIWKDPGLLMSNPPRRQYRCPGCGWITFGAP